MHRRIAVDATHNALRLLAKPVARSLNAIAPDIVERSAAALHVVANVFGIDVEVAEASDDAAQLANAARFNECVRAQPLRMAADHKSLADLHAGPRADQREDRRGL